MASKGNDKSEKKLEKPRFQEGERILCYHGPLIYEAKCVDIQSGENGHNYYIHYQGWNKSWDEWVQEERLLKFNEENIKMKDELFKNSKTMKKSSKNRRASIGSVGDKEENNSRSNSPKPGSELDTANVNKSFNQDDVKDEDMIFFYSLLPQMKKLDSHQKTLFYMKVHRYMYELLRGCREFYYPDENKFQ